MGIEGRFLPYAFGIAAAAAAIGGMNTACDPEIKQPAVLSPRTITQELGGTSVIFTDNNFLIEDDKKRKPIAQESEQIMAQRARIVIEAMSFFPPEVRNSLVPSSIVSQTDKRLPWSEIQKNPQLMALIGAQFYEENNTSYYADWFSYKLAPNPILTASNVIPQEGKMWAMIQKVGLQYIVFLQAEKIIADASGKNGRTLTIPEQGKLMAHFVDIVHLEKGTAETFPDDRGNVNVRYKGFSNENTKVQATAGNGADLQFKFEPAESLNELPDSFLG